MKDVLIAILFVVVVISFTTTVKYYIKWIIRKTFPKENTIQITIDS